MATAVRKRPAKAGSDNGALPGMESEFQTSKKVDKAANLYKQASISKSQAGDEFNARKLALLEAMHDDGITAVRIEIDGVAKVLRIDTKETIKQETPKKKKEDDC